MRITKHEHAALRLEHDGQTLLIDPGTFTAPLDGLSGVVAVVITHEHPDHWTAAHLQQILQEAPGIPILSTAGVASEAAEAVPDAITVVAPGETHTIGAFTLRFFGGAHAVIHSTLPAVENVAVLVNDEFYYPGDSYAIPEGVRVSTLAAPLGAPWLKIGEAMDFVLAIAPRSCFGTHDMTLSAIGRSMHRQRLQWATEQGGGQFFELDPGMSLEV
ncbi:MBL fold metallo-hydrolase [Microbacterium alcoholitolerans]|uniref:MBL fold metallo-hydrolase n=1 Tax=unclassified Microbacterium TaxID=2609290 RepID=UPI003D187380